MEINDNKNYVEKSTLTESQDISRTTDMSIKKLMQEPYKDVFEFSAKEIEWYPEDAVKMESMAQEEKMEYKHYLKINNRYTYK